MPSTNNGTTSAITINTFTTLITTRTNLDLSRTQSSVIAALTLMLASPGGMQSQRQRRQQLTLGVPRQVSGGRIEAGLRRTRTPRLTHPRHEALLQRLLERFEAFRSAGRAATAEVAPLPGRASDCTALDLSNMALGMAKSGVTSPVLWEGLTEAAAARRLRDFGTQETANLAWCLAQAHRDFCRREAAAVCGSDVAGGCRTSAVANTAAADHHYGIVGVVEGVDAQCRVFVPWPGAPSSPPPPSAARALHPAWLPWAGAFVEAVLAPRIRCMLRFYTNQQAANAAWALAALGHADCRTLDAVAAVAEASAATAVPLAAPQPQPPTSPASRSSTAIHPKALVALTRVACAQTDRFSAQGLSNLMWGLGVLGFRSPRELRHLAAREALLRLPELQPLGLATLLEDWARARRYHPALFATAAQLAVTQLQNRDNMDGGGGGFFQPRTLARLLRACGAVGHANRRLFLAAAEVLAPAQANAGVRQRRVGGSAAAPLDELSPGELYQLAVAYGRVGVHAPRLMDELLARLAPVLQAAEEDPHGNSPPLLPRSAGRLLCALAVLEHRPAALTAWRLLNGETNSSADNNGGATAAAAAAAAAAVTFRKLGRSVLTGLSLMTSRQALTAVWALVRLRAAGAPAVMRLVYLLVRRAAPSADGLAAGLVAVARTPSVSGNPQTMARFVWVLGRGATAAAADAQRHRRTSVSVDRVDGCRDAADAGAPAMAAAASVDTEDAEDAEARGVTAVFVALSQGLLAVAEVLLAAGQQGDGEGAEEGPPPAGGEALVALAEALAGVLVVAQAPTTVGGGANGSSTQPAMPQWLYDELRLCFVAVADTALRSCSGAAGPRPSRLAARDLAALVHALYDSGAAAGRPDMRVAAARQVLYRLQAAVPSANGAASAAGSEATSPTPHGGGDRYTQRQPRRFSQPPRNHRRLEQQRPRQRGPALKLPPPPPRLSPDDLARLLAAAARLELFEHPLAQPLLAEAVHTLMRSTPAAAAGADDGGAASYEHVTAMAAAAAGPLGYPAGLAALQELVRHCRCQYDDVEADGEGRCGDQSAATAPVQDVRMAGAAAVSSSKGRALRHTLYGWAARQALPLLPWLCEGTRALISEEVEHVQQGAPSRTIMDEQGTYGRRGGRGAYPDREIGGLTVRRRYVEFVERFAGVRMVDGVDLGGGFGEVPIVAVGTINDGFGPAGFGSDDEEPIFLSPFQRRLRERGGLFGYGGGTLGMLNSMAFSSLSSGLTLRHMRAAAGGSATATAGNSNATNSDTRGDSNSIGSGAAGGADGGSSAGLLQPRQIGLLDLHNRVSDLTRNRIQMLEHNGDGSDGSGEGSGDNEDEDNCRDEEDGGDAGNVDGLDDDEEEEEEEDLWVYSEDDWEGDEAEEVYTEYFDDEAEEFEEEEEDGYDTDSYSWGSLAAMAPGVGLHGSSSSGGRGDAELPQRTATAANGSAIESAARGLLVADASPDAVLGPRPASDGSGSSCSSRASGATDGRGGCAGSLDLFADEGEPLLAAYRAAEADEAQRPRSPPNGGPGAANTASTPPARRASSVRLDATSIAGGLGNSGREEEGAPLEAQRQPLAADAVTLSASVYVTEEGEGHGQRHGRPPSGVEGRRRSRSLSLAWAAARFALSAVLVPLRLVMFVAGLSSDAFAVIARRPPPLRAMRVRQQLVASAWCSTGTVSAAEAPVASPTGTLATPSLPFSMWLQRRRQQRELGLGQQPGGSSPPDNNAVAPAAAITTVELSLAQMAVGTATDLTTIDIAEQHPSSPVAAQGQPARRSAAGLATTAATAGGTRVAGGRSRSTLPRQQAGQGILDIEDAGAVHLGSSAAAATGDALQGSPIHRCRDLDAEEADGESTSSGLGSDADLDSDSSVFRFWRQLADADVEELVSAAGIGCSGFSGEASEQGPCELGDSKRQAASRCRGSGGSGHAAAAAAASPTAIAASAARSPHTAGTQETAGGLRSDEVTTARMRALVHQVPAARRPRSAAGCPRPFGSARALLRPIAPPGVPEGAARPLQQPLPPDHPSTGLEPRNRVSAPLAAIGGGSGADDMQPTTATATGAAAGAPLLLRGRQYGVPEASDRLQRLLLRRVASMENMWNPVQATQLPPPRPAAAGAAGDELGGLAVPSCAAAAAMLCTAAVPCFPPRLLRLPNTELGVEALNQLSETGPWQSAGAGPVRVVETNTSTGGHSPRLRSLCPSALAAAAGSTFGGSSGGAGETDGAHITAWRNLDNGGDDERGREARSGRRQVASFGGHRRPQQRQRHQQQRAGRQSWDSLDDGADGGDGNTAFDGRSPGRQWQWCYYYSDGNTDDYRGLPDRTCCTLGGASETHVNPRLPSHLGLRPLSRGPAAVAGGGQRVGGGSGAARDLRRLSHCHPAHPVPPSVERAGGRAVAPVYTAQGQQGEQQQQLQQYQQPRVATCEEERQLRRQRRRQGLVEPPLSEPNGGRLDVLNALGAVDTAADDTPPHLAMIRNTSATLRFARQTGNARHAVSVRSANGAETSSASFTCPRPEFRFTTREDDRGVAGSRSEILSTGERDLSALARMIATGAFCSPVAAPSPPEATAAGAAYTAPGTSPGAAGAAAASVGQSARRRHAQQRHERRALPVLPHRRRLASTEASGSLSLGHATLPEGDLELEEIAACLSPRPTMPVAAAAAPVPRDRRRVTVPWRLGAAASISVDVGESVSGGDDGDDAGDALSTPPPFEPLYAAEDGSVFGDAGDVDAWAQGLQVLVSDSDESETARPARCRLPHPRRWLHERHEGPVALPGAVSVAGRGEGVRGVRGAGPEGGCPAAAGGGGAEDGQVDGSSGARDPSYRSDSSAGWWRLGQQRRRPGCEDVGGAAGLLLGQRRASGTGVSVGGDGSSDDENEDEDGSWREWWALPRGRRRASGGPEHGLGGVSHLGARQPAAVDNEQRGKCGGGSGCGGHDGSSVGTPQSNSTDVGEGHVDREVGKAACGDSSIRDGASAPQLLNNEDGGAGAGVPCADGDGGDDSDGDGDLVQQPLLGEEGSDDVASRNSGYGHDVDVDANGLTGTGSFGAEFDDHLQGLDDILADELYEHGYGGWDVAAGETTVDSDEGSDDVLPPLNRLHYSSTGANGNGSTEGAAVAGGGSVTAPAGGQRGFGSTTTTTITTTTITNNNGSWSLGGGATNTSSGLSIYRRMARERPRDRNGPNAAAGACGDEDDTYGGESDSSGGRSSPRSLPPLLSNSDTPRGGGSSSSMSTGSNHSDSTPSLVHSETSSDGEPSGQRRRRFAWVESQGNQSSQRWPQRPPAAAAAATVTATTGTRATPRPASVSDLQRTGRRGPSSSSPSSSSSRQTAAAISSTVQAREGISNTQSGAETSWAAAMEALLRALLDFRTVASGAGGGASGNSAESSAWSLGLEPVSGLRGQPTAATATATASFSGLLRPRTPAAFSGGGGSGGGGGATSQIVASLVRIPADMLINVPHGSVVSITIPAGGFRGAGAGGGGGGGGTASTSGSDRPGGDSSPSTTATTTAATTITSAGTTTTTAARILPIQLGGMSSFPLSWRRYLPPEDSDGSHPNDRPGLPGSYEEQDIPSWAVRFAPPRVTAAGAGRSELSDAPLRIADGGAGPGSAAAANLASGRGLQGPVSEHDGDAGGTGPANLAATSPGFPTLWEDFSFSFVNDDDGDGDGDTDNSHDDDDGDDDHHDDEEEEEEEEEEEDYNGEAEHGQDSDTESFPDSLPDLIPLDVLLGASGLAQQLPQPPPEPPAAGAASRGLAAVGELEAAGDQGSGGDREPAEGADGAFGGVAAGIERDGGAGPAGPAAGDGSSVAEQIHSATAHEPHEHGNSPGEGREGGPARQTVDAGAVPPNAAGSAAGPRGLNTVSRYAGPLMDGDDTDEGNVAAAPGGDPGEGGGGGELRTTGGTGVMAPAPAAAAAGPRPPGTVPARRNAVAYPRSVLLSMLEALRLAETAVGNAMQDNGARGVAGSGSGAGDAAAAATAATRAPGLVALGSPPPPPPPRPARHVAAAAALLRDGAFVAQLLNELPEIHAMGVFGLITQLVNAGAKPRVVSLQNGEADGRPDNLLLVDAFNVLYYLVSKIPDAIDWKSTEFHGQLYQETCRYFGGLQRSGLRCVLIADSATAPRHERLYTESTRHALTIGQVIPPTAELVMFQACRDLGLEIIRSVHSADDLLLAWAHRHRDAVFAVLSKDSDFLVLGVPKIVHPQDVIIDARCVCLHVWSTEDAWRAWHMAAAGPAGAYMPPLLRRAQVAAVLGNDMGMDLRHRLMRHRTAAFSGAGGGLRPGVVPPISPGAAARAVVHLPSNVKHLDVNFFRKRPISLREFSEDDLTQINDIVQAYLDQDRAARDGSILRDLTLTEAALPWLDPAVANRFMAAGPLPSFLAEISCRGLATMTLVDPFWQQLRVLRRAVAEALLDERAPGAAFEYEPSTNTLHPLTGGRAATVERSVVDWFQPKVHLPELPVVDAAAAAAKPSPQRQATLQQTVTYLREMEPELPASLAVVYSLMLHAVDPDPAAWDEQAVREVLVPGVPPRSGADAPPAMVAAAVEADEADAAAAAVGLRTTLIDVGSALNERDWNDIDDKEVVGQVRSGGGYKLLKEIQPWDQLAAVRGRSGAAAMGGNTLFALARRALEAGPRSSEWAAAQDLLDMVDEHLKGAERQPQRLRARPLHVILSTPTGSGKTFTAVMLHLHVLRDMERPVAGATGRGGAGKGGAAGAVDAVAAEGRTGHPQTILVYSVPTKQVLKRVGQECEAHGVVYWTAARDGDFFQVRRPYSIRTKRGGGSTGAGTMRQQLEENAKRGATNEDLGGGKPDVIIADIYATAALVQVASEAPHDAFYRSSNLVLYLDEPNMGIHLDKEVRQVVRQIMSFAPPTTILASATLPGWDDLPAWWKGSGATAATHAVITQEPYELPTCRLTVLDDVSGQLVPVSPLELFDDVGQLATTLERSPRARVLLLRYFTSEQANQLLGLEAGAPAAAANRSEAKASPDGKKAGAAAVANGSGGTAGAEEEGKEKKKKEKKEKKISKKGKEEEPDERGQEVQGEERKEQPQQQEEEEEQEQDEGWKMLDLDVRGLRSELLEPALRALSTQPDRFQELREAWRQPAVPAPGDMRDVLSKQGVTLVATMEPRKLALKLAGKSPADQERWAAEAHALRAKVREAAADKRAADKARERAAKRGDEEGGRAGVRDDGLSGAGRVALRPGLTVWADEADDVTDVDTLVMLSKGVAYTASKDVEPLVKRLYQQALLYVPERAGTRPPLHTLVVDYSAVYGTDCPAVDTIILCSDLAEHLSWEDHQQFMGRLRRDGTVIYPSMGLLRRAVLGGGRQQWAEREGGRQEQQRRQVEEVLDRHVAPTTEGAAADATKAATRELLRLVRPGSLSRADVASLVLMYALRDVVRVSAGSGATQLCAAALRRLKQWGPLKPLQLLEFLKLNRAAEQRRLVSALEELCMAPAGPDSTAALLPCAGRLLQLLAEEELVEEEGMAMWCEAAAAAALQGPAGMSGAAYRCCAAASSATEHSAAPGLPLPSCPLSLLSLFGWPPPVLLLAVLPPRVLGASVALPPAPLPPPALSPVVPSMLTVILHKRERRAPSFLRRQRNVRPPAWPRPIRMAPLHVTLHHHVRTNWKGDDVRLYQPFRDHFHLTCLMSTANPRLTDKMEAFYIAQYNCLGPDGYNVLRGPPSASPTFYTMTQKRAGTAHTPAAALQETAQLTLTMPRSGGHLDALTGTPVARATAVAGPKQTQTGMRLEE
ncbi:hypothetical protein VOLCADRAFT_97614 [Volvox carteri f. nagariensis]|uniref:Uncharacterized protein n=1 Tax=Volvox carteri f. nagariensis TaxID=3068 RepID=D8UD66_VOLCA|nr:uncharacterized protein VOLCADRAFT_97614 [Volvox carteri f. nagariensis]EFJ42340.1 hypothetical protein VOLCADRAFT_97614 [Volvox carteri f. nagariensis]|eukprot:XP_002956573.1 hypothetical protein VOLCADRAFT_97614 [Volvox carteri f. nagariensis]